MNGFTAFLGKELREIIRTKRLLILLSVFVIVGIMNPAIAKLTPKILEMEADSMASMGLYVSGINVTALDSWTQFAKNIPFALIVTLITFSSSFTSEYSKGTLIPLLTKGLSRTSTVLSKFTVMFAVWSAGMWLSFAVTYFYSGFYWDNSAVKELLFAGFCWWLFGVMMLSCIVFFSSFASSGGQVMLGSGALYVLMLLLGISKKTAEYLPTRLTAVASLFTGELLPSDFSAPAAITAAVSLCFLLAALPITHKRKI